MFLAGDVVYDDEFELLSFTIEDFMADCVAAEIEMLGDQKKRSGSLAVRAKLDELDEMHVDYHAFVEGHIMRGTGALTFYAVKHTIENYATERGNPDLAFNAACEVLCRQDDIDWFVDRLPSVWVEEIPCEDIMCPICLVGMNEDNEHSHAPKRTPCCRKILGASCLITAIRDTAERCPMCRSDWSAQIV